MKPATRLAIGAVVVLVAVVAAAAAATIISINAGRNAGREAAQIAAARDVSESQRYWCDALILITSTPVPAPANPAAHQAQMTEYRLYLDFVTLRKVFGCKLSGTA